MTAVRVLVTGSNGFIGRNLCVRLRELNYEVLEFRRDNSLDELRRMVARSDRIIHLAGVNRPVDIQDFVRGNAELTATLCECIAETGRQIPLIISSSIQVNSTNPYADSKRMAEQAAVCLAAETGNPVTIYRLPNVFGKWCKPNYNSVVATFCSNVANDLPITIDDPAKLIALVYIDDVIEDFIGVLGRMSPGLGFGTVKPVHEITLGELAAQVRSFRSSRSSLVIGRVGEGLARGLYATYVSYLSSGNFAYDLQPKADVRGMFAEVLKTTDSGQFSFFTVRPQQTRGGHYHHTKTEKFVVVKGQALFRFRHILTDERFELQASSDKPQVVESVPGWVHDVTNIGEDEMVVMLWANEAFDHLRPDTVFAKV